MPLRDHFRPPLSDRRSWEGFHGAWPTMIVDVLYPHLPAHYVAEPQVHLGASIEVDVAAYEAEGAEAAIGRGAAEAGDVAPAWEPPQPTMAVAIDLDDPPEYEVRVYDAREGRQLVAAVELVSPANKDRPEHRRAFVAKCAAMLRAHACVAIVDPVTIRSADLFGELLEFLDDEADPASGGGPTPLYAVACRFSRGGGAPLLQTWAHPLELGRPLPTLPLWLAPNLAVPLELEASYEATCRVLRIP